MKLGIITLVAVFLLGCVHSPKVLTGPELADITAEKSVALTISDEDGTRAYCSGTWVGEGFILTAGHCVKGLQEMTNTSDEGLYTLDFEYVTSHDVNDPRGAPSNKYIAHYSGIDEDHDLGLLYTSQHPYHPIAQLATKSPPVGSPITSIGASVGFYWTFLKGVVAAYREDLSGFVDKTGPFLQAYMGLAPGDSGGGLFDEHGDLVGVASFINRKVPLMSFAIHLDSVRSFLEKEHVPTGLHKE